MVIRVFILYCTHRAGVADSLTIVDHMGSALSIHFFDDLKSWNRWISRLRHACNFFILLLLVAEIMADVLASDWATKVAVAFQNR